MDLPLTIKEAAAALRSGTLTSVQITSTMLDRIRTLNPTLGAFITVSEETAMAEAAAADAAFAAGTDLGPMQGIPYAAKDIIATKDAPTTANGVILDPAWGEGYDAVVIERLRAAGAVLMGKLVLNEFAIGMPDATKPFPMPQNPWDLERSGSGSSSGTGIALAAGLIYAGLGTDTGGSTRGPSSWNGVSGMKQTFGRVPKWGCVPLGYSLDSINPMARSAYDCAAMLAVMAGADRRDPCTVDVPVPDYTAAMTGSVEGLRIGVPKPYFFDSPELDPETRDAVLAAVEVLRGAGAIVTEVEVPHAREAKDANQLIMLSEAFAYHRGDLIARFDEYGRYTSEVLTRGLFFTGGDVVQAQRFRSYFKKAMAAVLADLDVIITPTSVGPAPRRADMNPSQMLSSPSFTGPWNLSGLPAMAIPCGFSTGGLPLSMQIVGKPFAEATVFQVGGAYQELTDWHLQVPPIAQEVASVA